MFEFIVKVLEDCKELGLQKGDSFKFLKSTSIGVLNTNNAAEVIKAINDKVGKNVANIQNVNKFKRILEETRVK